MEVLIFLGGFLTGAIVVFVVHFILSKQMNMSFENTANKILKQSTGELTEQNRERLEEFYKRFKERIEDFEKRSEENFKTETENFTRFDMNIKSFLEAGNRISQDTNSLVSVMKSDNRTSGRWGEIVLERVLEASGLRKNQEYTIQKGAAEGRPDATIFLPEDRKIFIDSKTSFSSWDNYINAEDEGEKQIHLRQFIDSTKAHINGLAKRDYSIEEGSPDYVLMFIPIESCYSLIFCEDCALWDFAWKNRVMPVSPSTLLAALKIINSFHVVDRQNKNAKEIADICTKMLDKFADMVRDLTKIQDFLSGAFTKLSGKGGIVSQIGRIEDLGIKMNKDLPVLPESTETPLEV